MNLPLEELNARSWKRRNAAVKSLGRHPSEEAALKIAEILTDSRPSGWLSSLLGEPYHQVGFIRRNAWDKLAVHPLPPSLNLDKLLLRGICDPYWEVRGQCLKTARCFFDKQVYHPGEETKEACMNHLLKGDLFDVLSEALRFCSRYCDAVQAGRIHELYRKHPHWRVRAALMEMLDYLCRREVLETEKTLSLLREVSLHEDDFKPVFFLKHKRFEIERRLHPDL